MSPSRGAPSEAPALTTPPSSSATTSTTTTTHTKHNHPNISNDDAAVTQQSNSALKNAKRNFSYFMHPSSPNGPRPARLRTRALLRTLRYVTQFIFWRIVRWAKYVAVGTLVAAIGATAFGSVVSGVAWIAAPPTIGASVLAAGVWGTGKFAARRLHARWKSTGGDEGQALRDSIDDGQSGVRVDGAYGLDLGPRAVPW
ncbi:hypothetical protein PV10_07481 [Exophiala mesophila]|uniref:Uncharacterized protein n=1 Tax=Exophiala mesophila TaxID=212818 RepID=A0A0D1XPV8_EXOME|nr:uncharacterized protein PV10_07481 [Exophiala mesophila]KIV90141.1 hypothetical protein PV10_07481 [Exophiala mesophila]